MSTSETITRTDLTNILNEVLPVYNSTGFTVEKFTASSATSVSANGGTAWIQVRIPSGYEPVCIVGYYLNGGSGCSVYNESIGKDSNGYYASFALRNGQSTANSVTIDAFVLCKQSLTHFTQAMADYIVEQGTSGDTTYRKWNSGIAECWIKTTKNVALNNSYGSLYQGTWTWTFPFAFVADPTVVVGHMQWGTGASWGTLASVSTTSCGIRGIDITSRASGTTYISAYAKGRWK